MKCLMNFIWLLTALGSIHLGLIGIGYNLFTLPIFQTTLAMIVVPTHYVFGLAGFISLAFYLMTVLNLKCPGCGCEASNCKCK